MSAEEVDVESSESEIDENDPYAPQLHYIRMQKRLKRVDKKMNPWIIRAQKCAPFLKALEKSLKYILIAGVLTMLVYWNYDKIANLGEKMAHSGSNSENGQDWEEDNYSDDWYFEFWLGMIKDNFSWFAIKEIGYYVILFVVILAGFGGLSYYNHQYDKRLEEIEEKIIEEEKAKQKKAAQNGAQTPTNEKQKTS